VAPTSEQEHVTGNASVWTIDRPRKTLRTRYTFALALTAFVVIAQFIILSDEIYAQRQQDRVVDTAATQRMLAVEIASLASEYVAATTDARPDVRARLRIDVERLAANERDLADPTSPENPRGWPPTAVRALFAHGDYDVSSRTRDYARHATRLLGTPDSQVSRSDEDFIFLDNVGFDLAFRYGAIVNAYVEDGQRERSALLLHEALALAALLITLALEFPLIFGPLETELDDGVRALVTQAHKRSGTERIAHLGTWERDVDTGTIDWSDELRRICAIAPNEPTPHAFAEFDHPDESPIVRRALRLARDAAAPYRIDHRIRTRLGETRWVQESLEYLSHADGTNARELGTAFDITERKAAESELYHQANHDVLTGLPNRRYLRTRIESELAAAAERGTSVALLYADLDRFKLINDSLGHSVGDELLRQTAHRLLGNVRDDDIVARSGGDEFVVAIVGMRDTAEAEATARRIVTACASPIAIAGKDLYAPLSIGVAIFPQDADSVDGLMRAADRAMYQAKTDGGGRFQPYSRTLEPASSDRLALETQLRMAIERGKLDVYYQPIVANDGRTIALEALVRWPHPELGLIGPDRFIPIAEETGLIHALGRFVLARASAFVRTLQHGEYAELRLAVNVSSNQFRNVNFGATVHETLAATGFDASLLDLEITESTVMHDLESAIATMHVLKAMRVRISIDDFGTGFSSLAYLRRFPIDTLKIDRTFVRELPGNASDAAIVESIVGLARNLKLRVVAEGIETSEQCEMLVRLQCSELQGYFFSRPMHAADVATFLARPPANVGPAQTRLSLVC